MTLLGIDVGTSAIKAAIFDDEGTEIAEAREPTPWRGTELDPGDLLAATRKAMDALPGPFAAIGVAGIAETGILLDARGRPVVPALAWHDPRGEEHAADLHARLGDRFAERVGLPVRPLCSLVKYAWMREHWPDARKGVRWLSVAEWIVRELGGEEAAESSLASRTAFYDLHTKRPYDEALAWAEAPPGLVPEHVPAGTPLGTDAKGAVLTVGGHDHLAAAVGAGVSDPGEVLDSWGTAEAWIRATDPLTPDQVRASVGDGVTVGWHAIEGRQALLGAARSGAALQAVLDLIGGDPTTLDPQALHTDPGTLQLAGFPDGPFTITGLEPGADPGALYRAAHESLGREGARVLARMDAIAGPRTRLVVTGGWAEGACARHVKAAHLGPFEHAPGIATGARGAALAALRAYDAQPAPSS